MKKLLALLLSAMLLFSAAALAETEVHQVAELANMTVVIDPANPLTSQYFGLYQDSLTMADGTVRTIYQYVPTTWIYRQPEVAVAVPSDKDPIAFFEDSGWKDASEAGQFAVILMVAGEGGYAADESEYAMAVFNYMDARTNLQTQDSAFYMVGYGDGANMVMAHAVVNSELFAGFAAFGVDHFDLSVLEQGKEESGMPGVSKSEVAVPMWIGCDEKTASVDALISYWKNANDCGDDAVSNAYADEIYTFTNYLALDNALTINNVATVRVTVGLEDVATPDFTNQLWDKFLRRVRRQDSGRINSLRAFATNEELGMEHYTTVVNGTTREYFVFVPTAVKSGRKTNVPVVIVFHGGGGSGEEFANRSCWYKVAEEREFVCVFPTGSRSGNKIKASTGWTVADVDFFKVLREEVLANYSIDPTRVYVTGHSAGGQMVHNVTLYAPELVAAGAANAAPVLTITEDMVTDIVMPILESAGVYDKYFVEGGNNYQKMPGVMQEWLKRYGITTTEDETLAYQNGRYYGYIWTNADGLPILREQWIEEKIHAFIPEEAYTVYDFLANYSRDAEGNSYYMGQKIEMK